MKDIPDEEILKEASTEKYPSHEEMTHLNTLRLQGDSNARDQMIVRNLSLARWFASRLHPVHTANFEDTFQDAAIGIMKAVDRFDPEKGKFGTFAIHWIRQNTFRQRANTGFTIRIPIHLRTRARKVDTVKTALYNELGREPCVEEISKRTGFSKTEVEKILRLPLFTSSLDGSADNPEGASGYDLHEDSSARTPDQTLEIKDACRDITQKFLYLYEELKSFYHGEKKKKVIIFCRRFGIFGQGPSRTLEEVSREFDMTRERVRQICVEIFKRCKKRRYVFTSEVSLEANLAFLRSGIEIIAESENRVPQEMLWILGKPSENDS